MLKRRHILFFTLIIITAYSNITRAAEAPESITIGFIPGDDPEAVKSSALSFARLLQSKTGVATNVYLSKTYSGLIDAMKTKKIDFAFFSALTFVFAEKTAGAKVLLKRIWDSPFYYSIIITKSDGGIKNIQQLKGKRFAFVDENSASGYLYPKIFLKSKGIDPDKDFKSVIFTGNHAASSELLREGKVDGAAIYANDAKAQTTAYSKTVVGPKPRVLWTSQPIPTDPFCVRQDFYDRYPKTTHDVMFSIIDLQEGPQAAEFKKVLDAKAMVLATTQQYEPVRKIVRELNLKLEDK